MPLATILAVCALVASPPSGAAGSVKVLLLAQENQPAQEPPQTTSPPPPAPPAEPEAKPAESSAPPPTSGQEPSAQPASPQPDSTPKKPAAATQPKKHRRKRKPAATGAGTTKTVVPNGSTPDPKVQIAPSLTEEQASHQRQNTTQLLASTDANLKKISGRQLSASQQDVVKQIHTYIEQAKAAEEAGDLQRARNLAFKAHLLSDELLKH
jgi:outer membrane biosynthesis protein TonB